MKNLVLTFCFVFMSIIGLYSQDLPATPPHNWTNYLNVETGFIFPTGNIKDDFSIRQNISSFYVDQSTNGEISSETSGVIVGLNWEFFNARLKTGVSTGLRFIGFQSKITGFSSSNSDFFYLRYSMENSDTKFARVNSISETNNLITVPFELRYVFIQYKGFSLFTKAGVEMSISNLGKKTNINFREDSMEANQDEVLDNIGIKTNKFYSSAFASIGMKLGQENKRNYIFEVFLPSLFLTKDNFTLTDVENFSGFRFAVRFPIIKQN